MKMKKEVDGETKASQYCFSFLSVVSMKEEQKEKDKETNKGTKKVDLLALCLLLVLSLLWMQRIEQHIH